MARTLLTILLSFFASMGCLAAEPAPQPKLQKLLIADSEQAVLNAELESTTTSVGVSGVPLLQTLEFDKIITPFLGQPISNELINQIAQRIHTYIKSKDRLILNVQVPKQDISKGVLRIVARLGQYHNLVFQGNRWFSSKLLAAKLGVKPGDEVLLSTLDEGLAWSNKNPFRQVQVRINDLQNNDPGKADLIVSVAEHIPLRAIFSYSNSGVKLLGQNQYSAVVQYGNAWGLDHFVSYQYTTSDKPDIFKAHSIDYRVPLPWRHYVQLTAGYARVSPTFASGYFTQKGESLITELKYIVPVQVKGIDLEFSAGVNFKESNNNLEFGGTQVLSTKNDIAQAFVSGSVMRKDKQGAWFASTTLYLSPGSFNSRNTAKSYEQARVLAQPRYMYGVLMLQRLNTLPLGMQIVNTGTLQRASTNLLGSEQMTIGGAGSVRGYEERLLSGDQGFQFTSELQGPQWSLPLVFVQNYKETAYMRLLAFVDYAHVSYKTRIAADYATEALYSSAWDSAARSAIDSASQESTDGSC